MVGCELSNCSLAVQTIAWNCGKSGIAKKDVTFNSRECQILQQKTYDIYLKRHNIATLNVCFSMRKKVCFSMELVFS